MEWQARDPSHSYGLPLPRNLRNHEFGDNPKTLDENQLVREGCSDSELPRRF